MNPLQRKKEITRRLNEAFAPESLGVELAEKLVALGASEILDAIRDIEADK